MDTRGPIILAAVCSTTIISTLVVVARFFSGNRTSRIFHLDDYLIVAGILCGWLGMSFSIAAVHSGEGRHITTLTKDEIYGAVLWTIVSYLPGIFFIGLPKMAVVCLLTRVLKPTKYHKIFLWILPCFSTGSLLISLVLIFVQCQPPRSQWDLSVTEKSCWSPWILVNYTRYSCSVSAFVDLYLSIYPTIILVRLQMDWRKKLATSMILGFGISATIIALIKITTLTGLTDPDFTWTTADLTLLTSVEGNAITIAACAPKLKPLIERVLKRKILLDNQEPRLRKWNETIILSWTGHHGRAGQETARGSTTLHTQDSGNVITRTDEFRVTYGPELDQQRSRH
ncbi:hypothetical protein GQ53DRAFT_639419 [Thozetella sp. PMI_491]|nr:hypothetical protein GQ53DRAFT_639419 [Thozetella sp. PMI_491]